MESPPAAATWQLPIGQPPVTWQLRQHQSTPPATGQRRRSTTVNAAGHRSTTVDHGGDRRSTGAVYDGRRWQTIVDCCWTTVDHHRTTEKSPLDFSNEDPPLLITDRIGTEDTLEGKSLAAMGIRMGPTISAPATQETLVHAEGVSDPDPLSYAKPPPAPKLDIAQSSGKAVVTEDPDFEKSTSFTSMVGSPGSIYQPRWGVTNNCRLDTPTACQDMVDHIVPPGYFLELRHLANDEFLNQYNTTLGWIVAMGSQLRLRFEQETKLLKKAIAQAQVTGEERIKVAFKEFKKYEDDRLFADVMSVGIAKGMSEGIKHGVEHEKAKVDLAAIKAYDPEANTKYVAAFHAQKDLKYSLVDQLEKLKDAPIDVIMSSLYLESDSEEDAS
nr:hypothetical protein [Tanacetum cinerariifolium]